MATVSEIGLGHAHADGSSVAAKPDWNDFRVFTAVARTGSYTRAAKELGVVQSVVSRAMIRLEKDLGVRLFDRTKNGSRITAEGERLLNYANSAETMLHRGVEAVRDNTTRAVSECKVTMGDGLGILWVPSFVPSFVERYPNVSLKLFTSNEPGNRTPLFDLQIHYSMPLSEDAVATQLGTLHFVVYASRSYLEKFGMPETRDDLRQHRIVDQTFRLTDKGSLASWARLHDSAIIRTNSSTMLMEMVRGGAGLAVLPSYASVFAPELVPVMLDMHFSAPIFLCYEREASLKYGVKSAIEFFRKQVFDPKTMPWFAMDFIAPNKEWPRMFAERLRVLNASGNRVAAL
jgi:DNA-binding transcriptional LysR family regulator